MQSKATRVEEYIAEVPRERRPYFEKLRETILENIPEGFEEQISYGMIGYVVPHSLYPEGYHCNVKLPLPFTNIASQKRFIGFYHMGIYSNPALIDWFITEYPKHSKLKLDMGKSCVRFNKAEHIPYTLIGELMTKISVDDWIKHYESIVKRKK